MSLEEVEYDRRLKGSLKDILRTGNKRYDRVGTRARRDDERRNRDLKNDNMVGLYYSPAIRSIPLDDRSAYTI